MERTRRPAGCISWFSVTTGQNVIQLDHPRTDGFTSFVSNSSIGWQLVFAEGSFMFNPNHCLFIMYNIAVLSTNFMHVILGQHCVPLTLWRSYCHQYQLYKEENKSKMKSVFTITIMSQREVTCLLARWCSSAQISKEIKGLSFDLVQSIEDQE